MTLDEAIKHAEEVADKKEREKQKWEKWLETDNDFRAVTEKVSCELCAEEHRQLAEWLKKLKRLKQPCEDCISRQAVLDDLEKSHMTSGVLNQGVWNECVDSMMRTVRSMPSVTSQPGPIRINLNEPIKVKLTDWGKEIYYHQYDRINQIAGREICKPKFPKEDENGYTEFQLWYFIELYGEYIGMGLPNIIEPLDIVYKR